MYQAGTSGSGNRTDQSRLLFQARSNRNLHHARNYRIPRLRSWLRPDAIHFLHRLQELHPDELDRFEGEPFARSNIAK